MRSRDLTRVAIFAALTAVGAFLRIPMPLASVTLQFFFTMMAGLLLGPKLGALSQGVYLALGLLGLPVFTQGGGVGYLLRPTFGFLLGLVPTAFVVGKIGSRGKASFGRMVASGVAGLAVLYAVGLPYLYLVTTVYLHQPLTIGQLLWGGMLIFLPGDAAKIVLAALLCKKIQPCLS